MTDEIDARAVDRDVFHKVKARAEKGSSRERLINQNEFLAVIRWAAFCENAMLNLAEIVADQQTRTNENMGVLQQGKVSEIKD